MSGDQTDVVSRALLCCSLCHDDFTEPKILPCLHSFCKGCLERQETQMWHDGKAACPDCFTLLNLDQRGLDGLPSNLFLQRLLFPRTKSSTTPSDCRRCHMLGNAPTEATYCCINCDEILCDECCRIHQEEVETNSHQIKSKHTEKSKKVTTKNNDESINKCCLSCDASVTSFCVTCDTLACPECQQKYHREGHRLADLHAVAMNFENRVDEPLADLEDTANELSDRVSILERQKVEAKDKTNKLRDSVDERKNFLIEMIENYANTVKAEIDRQYEQNISDIEQQKCEMQSQIACINAVLNFTDTLLAYGTDEEKVALRKKIGGRIRHLSDIDAQKYDSQPSDISFFSSNVPVEMICNLFGELKTDRMEKADEIATDNQSVCKTQDSVDSGHFSDVNGELYDLGASFDGGQQPSNSLNLPRQRIRKKSVQFDNIVTQSSYETDLSFQLDTPVRKFPIPDGIKRDCIKGMGINRNGDIIIGTVFSEGQCIYIVEKHGIIRGKVPIEKGWTLHSVASDGKVAMSMTRGDNRYKVRVLQDDCSTVLVEESTIQSYGLHFVTANSQNQVIVTSNRYSKLCARKGRSVKLGGNIAIHDKIGHLDQRITNESFQDFDLYVLEKPNSLVVDHKNNIYVADPGSHLVAGFSCYGDLLFTYGKEDGTKEQCYQGPDSVALDDKGNLIVTDRKSNRIDILSPKGEHRKTFYIQEYPKFVAAGMNKQIMVASPDGMIKFYEYD